MPWGGTSGQRYGYFALNTAQWAIREGAHTPPVQVGEQFQLWTAASSNTFPFPVPYDTGKISSASGSLATGGAGDLFAVYPATLAGAAPGALNRDGMPASYAPQWVLKDPQACTVAGVQQDPNGTWYVFFSPQLAQNETVTDGKDGIITIPQVSSPRWLGRIGHVAGLTYSYTLPGGPAQLTCTLQIRPDFRTDALNPGRIITAHRGGSTIWEGKLTEPVSSAAGWSLTANGCGTYGTSFGAWWDMALGSAGWTHLDAPVDHAIGRGLRWVNRGIGSPSTVWEGPQQDAGSITVTDFCNLLCTGGSLTWILQPPASASSFPPGPWELKIYPLPTDFSGNPLVANEADRVQPERVLGSHYKRIDRIVAEPRIPPDLYLINTNPVPRTVNADINTIIVHYQVTPDKTSTSSASAQTATYATTIADQPSSVALHGRMEYYLDISNGGTFTRAQAAAIGANVLAKYVRANFTNPFTVMPGQLVTTGGVPVDLGCNHGGATVSVQVTNPAFGGEVGFGPLTFTIGNYTYDDQTQTAQVTPLQVSGSDIGSIIQELYPGRFSLQPGFT